MARNFPDSIPREFKAPTFADAYKRGWNHGHGTACHNVPERGVEYYTEAEGRVTADTFDELRDLHATLCHEACDNARQYSPFEFTAHEFNQSRYRDKLWSAFEQGTSDAIAADIDEYTAEDYGIEPDTEVDD